MGFTIRPAHDFADVAAILAPKNPDSRVCWCLTYRLEPKDQRDFTGPERAACMQRLCARELAPGVVAYDPEQGDLPVGWCRVAPKAELHTYVHSRTIPHVDDDGVWTINCFRVRAKNKGRGVARALLDGAIEFARSNGAPAIEAYPADTGGKPMNPTMAYVGTRFLFEAAGFRKVADTDAHADGFDRVLMRLDLKR